MREAIMQVINDFGHLGVFALIFIENIFPPIPSEAVLLFGGAITLSTRLTVPGVILAATLGSLAGAIALYSLGWALKAEKLKALFAGRFGKIMHLKPEHVDLAGAWFAKYEKRAVLICRCVPIVRSLISIPAGCNQMNLGWFLLLTTVGSLVWNTVLVSLGAALGNAWENALPYMAQYSHIIWAVVLLTVAVAALWYVVRKKRQKS